LSQAREKIKARYKTEQERGKALARVLAGIERRSDYLWEGIAASFCKSI
ncbi:hypothetical protein HKBW3C_02850, partial [Candidatus Hakubella thermalkaliphila]